MSEFTPLIDRYIAAWNETEPERRRDLIARTFTEDASFLDPLLAGDGHAAIDGLVAAVHGRFPGHRFAHKGEVDGHHDRVRFSWELVPEGGAAVAAGTDFAVIRDGRMQNVTGFFDLLPGA